VRKEYPGRTPTWIVGVHGYLPANLAPCPGKPWLSPPDLEERGTAGCLGPLVAHDEARMQQVLGGEHLVQKLPVQ
jgi:hypothetical protein